MIKFDGPLYIQCIFSLSFVFRGEVGALLAVQDEVPLSIGAVSCKDQISPSESSRAPSTAESAMWPHVSQLQAAEPTMS